MAEFVAPGAPQQLDLGELAATSGAAGGAAGTGGAGSSPGGADGYRFDPERIDAAIAKWQQLADELLVDGEIAVDLATIRGPGAEFASGMVSSTAQTASNAFVEANQSMLGYVLCYIEALTTARDEYLAQEQTHAETMRSKEAQL